MLKNMKIGGKLILVGTLIIAIPLVIVAIVVENRASVALQQLSDQQLVSRAGEIARTIDEMYSEEMKLAMSLANNPRLAAAAAPAAKLAGRAANESAVSDVHALLQGIMQLDSTYESVSLVDCQGNVISSGVSGLSGSNISSMGYFKEAIAGRANMGSVVISKDTGKPVTPIAVPVRLGENVVGAVVLALKIDFLGNMVAGNRVGRTGYVAVVDSAGMTLVG